MKKILLSLLTLILFTGIFAQVEEPHVNLDSLRDEIINKSQYVFEGVIIKQSSYLYNNHTPLESNIIQILKVFRGNLKPGTIELINYIESVGLDMDNPEEMRLQRSTVPEKLLRKRENVWGIFFCRSANEFPYNSKYNIDVVDNKIILASNDVIQPAPGGYKGNSLLKRGRITNKAELYKILKKYPNLNIPETAEKEPWDHDIITPEDFNKYLHDSLNHKGAFKLPKQAVQKKDSLKNVTRP